MNVQKRIIVALSLSMSLGLGGIHGATLAHEP